MFLTTIIDLGQSLCPLFGVERLPLLEGLKYTNSMGSHSVPRDMFVVERLS